MKERSINETELLLLLADTFIQHRSPEMVCESLAGIIRSHFDLHAVGMVLSGRNAMLRGLAVSIGPDSSDWVRRCNVAFAQIVAGGHCEDPGLHVLPLPNGSEPTAWIVASGPIALSAAAAERIGAWVCRLTSDPGAGLRDALTGLLDRGQIACRMQRALYLADRHQRMLCVMMIDLDNCKQVNDHYGHQAGDELLRVFAERLRRHVRGSDEAFRVGGDEFMVLLPETSLQDARPVGERLMSLVSGILWLPQSSKWKNTLSIGIAESDGRISWEQLVAKADKALYLAKRSGKGCMAGVGFGEDEPRLV